MPLRELRPFQAQGIDDMKAAIPIFYVYVIFRPDGEPCYVGKGHGRRINKHEWRAKNPHLAAIIRAAGGTLPKVKVREGLFEHEALEVEVAFIAAIGREANGGPLVNLTDGGEGTVGKIWSEKERLACSARMKANPPFKGRHHDERSRELLAEAHRGLKASEETRAKMRASRAKVKLTEEAKKEISEKISIAVSGERHGMYGKKHKEESKARIRAACKGVIRSKEYRQRMSLAQLRRWAEKRGDAHG